MRDYAVVGVGAQGRRSSISAVVSARGKARLSWDSVPGVDAYIVIRDGQEHSGLLRIEGSRKEWVDP